MTKVYHTSDRTDWRTPPELFSLCDDIFHLKLDAAASQDNALCEHYYDGTSGSDGLEERWTDATWCNPPYGRGSIEQWVNKAVYETHEYYVTSLLLVPARTDTPWFQYCLRQRNKFVGTSVIFIPGRLRFVGAVHSAPFPSVLIGFRDRGYNRFVELEERIQAMYPLSARRRK